MDVPYGQRLTLFDLPNEVSLIIMKYLSTVDVFSAFVGLTERLDQLILDPIGTRTLDMHCLRLDRLPDRIFSIDDRALETICRTVLPRIHHHVTKLIVDQFAIESVVRAGEYPELCSLSLLDIDKASVFDVLQGSEILCNLLNKQITSLVIDISDESTDESSTVFYSKIFHYVLDLCPRLSSLQFCSALCNLESHPIRFSSLTCRSAVLTELMVDITSFRQFIYLTEGHFPSLERLTIKAEKIGHTSSQGIHVKTLHRLKRFSLTSLPRTFSYDNTIVPFLQRMINLEKLTLHLSIIRVNSDYVNGVQLHDDILRYMPRLTKFNFSIDTAIIKTKCDLLLSSKEDIQQSFLGGRFGSVGSHVDVFAKKNGRRAHAYSLPHEFYSRCHIYSLPCQFSHWAFLSNSFQGGTFQNVRTLILTDCHPFEHEFFQTISRSFPALIGLYIISDRPQEDTKQSRMKIAFDRLRLLCLEQAHTDYARQFLTDQYCQVSRLHELQITYASLMSVTDDFTSAATRLTCSNLKHLRMPEPFVRPAHFHEYFLSL